MIELKANERTIPQLLQRAATSFAGRPCLTIGDTGLSYEQVVDAAAGYAGALASAGVEPGERVAIVAENCWEVLATWLACAWRGAVFVPVNTASRGPQFDHIISNAAPRLLVIESGLEERIGELEALPPELGEAWIIGGPGTETSFAVPCRPYPGPEPAIDPTQAKPGDTLAILYTSGTTGPSKGVMCPHAQFTWWAQNVGGWLGLGPADVAYTCLPLFHTNALNGFVQSLLHGSHYVVGPRFSASRFWSSLCESGATVTYLLGTMVSILAAREPSPQDAAHDVRVALAPATPPELWETFEARFGMRILEGHGMTETNAVIGPRDGRQRPGFMGRVMPGFEARVVDGDDLQLEDGSPGELVLRADDPFAFATGYWRMPEATVSTTRNLWFHSGDRVVRDSDGYFRFLDRTKDAIRRRGENISSWEVEQVLLSHAAIEAAAVVPVPSDLGEDEVMACVVPRRGATVDPAVLVRFCEPLLAYFAIPRYIDVLDALPLTENGKVRKAVLRERGVTATTWDREAAGIELRR